MTPPDTLWSGDSVPLYGFVTPASCLPRRRHRAFIQNEWIRVSHLPLLHNHSRISMAHAHHPIINHQRKLDGSSCGSRRSPDKVLDLRQIRRVMFGDKEKCGKHCSPKCISTRWRWSTRATSMPYSHHAVCRRFTPTVTPTRNGGILRTTMIVYGRLVGRVCLGSFYKTSRSMITPGT